MKRNSNIFITSILSLAFAVSVNAADVVIDMQSMGLKPNSKENLTPRLTRALRQIKAEHQGEAVTLKFAPGTYNFHQKGSEERTYFISNHDQTNPKSVAFAIEQWDNLTIDGSGADFIFHGRMLPVAVMESKGVSLRDFHIDFAVPHVSQVEVTASTPEGITFRPAPWVNASVGKKNHAFTVSGEGWEITPRSGIAFDGKTRHLVFNTGDLWCPLDSVIALKGGEFFAPKWKDGRLTPGTFVALRGWGRPTPGIFLSEDTDTRITDVKVHYAEGMGLLAQLCDNITMEGFGVCLRGDDDPRYFTTQADATHFSGCKGLISSTGGLYEGMMDDAINVHGTYLKVMEVTGPRTLRGRYMHNQSYGFKWGEPGDTVSLILSRTMEAEYPELVIEKIEALDSPVKDWEVTFTTDLPQGLDPQTTPLGLENLTWSPEVYFADNVIRNNRARGSLFSTPRHTVVERNLFDHTSGCAILLCGDCMGWFETGACHDVTIRQNRFVNALTNLFQFTEAVISIFPEIHDIDNQRLYFHSGVTITDNDFATFDAPILYAKSINGLTFTGNRVTRNHDFPAFHSNRYTFRLRRAAGVNIADNNFGTTSPSMLIE